MRTRSATLAGDSGRPVSRLLPARRSTADIRLACCDDVSRLMAIHTPSLAATCRIALLNPNTNADITRMMLEIARQAVPAGAVLEGRTAPVGRALISDETGLAEAAHVVEEYGQVLTAEGFDAIIISGFGDPGLQALRQRVKVPVTGIAEAGIAEAAERGRRYAIVTTTPALCDSLAQTASRYGHAASLVAIRITEGDMLTVMQDPALLAAALLKSCRQAIDTDGARAIVLGGGPLARAAQAIAPLLEVPVIEPVGAAVRLTWRRCMTDRLP
jgi:Asp/Glu/hydantoin racemase